MQATPTFLIEWSPGRPGPDTPVVVICGERSLVFPRNGIQGWVPLAHWLRILPRLAVFVDRMYMLGSLEPLGPIYGLFLSPDELLRCGDDALVRVDAREYYLREHQELPFEVMARSLHLGQWIRATAQCAFCGGSMGPAAGEMARVCITCGRSAYPRINPAIIVTVVRDHELLLCQTQLSRSSWWSLVAGYVEPGENLEEAVHREVQEEVGLRIRNLTYIESQPWPFSQSLMIGFRADWESGEIRIDPREIRAARWYPLDELPEIPPRPSLAWKLISGLTL